MTTTFTRAELEDAVALWHSTANIAVIRYAGNGKFCGQEDGAEC